MRLWTLHPRYLDSQGLCALWREALLAQAVLHGGTRGYRNHPQLVRFRNHADPEGAVCSYLLGVHAESVERGYRFDKSKIDDPSAGVRMEATRGQLLWEWGHLKGKLSRRAPELYASLRDLEDPEPHPMFVIRSGPIAEWERAEGEAEPQRRPCEAEPQCRPCEAEPQRRPDEER